MTPEEIEALDPGIRRTVWWLQCEGFHTTDSGDGVSKKEAIEDNEALPLPHVFMTCDPKALIGAANKLRDLLCSIGLAGAGRVEGSYSPDDGIAIIALYDVNDDLLASTVPPSSKEKP